MRVAAKNDKGYFVEVKTPGDFKALIKATYARIEAEQKNKARVPSQETKS